MQIHRWLSVVSILIILANIPSESFAAIDPGTVWEVRTGGSDTNGGGFIGPMGANNLGTPLPAPDIFAAPSAPTYTCTSTGGTITGNTTYYGVNTFIGAFGHTGASSQGSVVVNNANCGGNTNTNKLTPIAPASAPGCQSGVTCTWETFISANNGGPWARSLTTQTLGVNGSITSIPALPGTQACGTDYTLQNNAQIAVTDGVANGTTTITSATAAFNGSHVCNVMYVQGGTGTITAGWYQILQITNSTTAIVDRSTGLTTGTGATLNLGGALASPGQATGSMAADNKIFLKNDGAGIYWIQSSSLNVAGGRFGTLDGDGGLAPSHMVGYTSVRALNNTDSRPTIKVCQNSTAPCTGAINSIVAVQPNSGGFGTSWLRNVIIDLNGATGSTGIWGRAGQSLIQDVKIINPTSDGIFLSVGEVSRSEVTGASGTAGINLAGTKAYGNYVHDGSVVGFKSSQDGSVLQYNISSNNTGDCYQNTSGFAYYYNNTAYGCSSHGFESASNGNLYRCNISEESGGVGYYANSAGGTSWPFDSNAGYHNNSTTVLSGQYTTNRFLNVANFINQSAGSYFTNAASGDFSLNNIAGQGALVRGACTPGVFPGGTTTGYNDFGAAIRQGGVTAAPPQSFAGVQ